MGITMIYLGLYGLMFAAYVLLEIAIYWEEEEQTNED